MKDIKPQEEMNLLNSVAKTIETDSAGKEEFIQCFSDGAELSFEGDPLETPSDLYDILVPDDTVVMKDSKIIIDEYYYPGSNLIEFDGSLSITVEGRKDNPQILYFLITINTDTIKITKIR
jgi:hypothetical protein